MAEHRDFREDDVTLSLIQFRAADGARHVAALSDDGQARIAPGVESVVALARQALAAGESEPTDSMKMSLVGVDGGKPAPGTVGAQPESSTRATAASARAAGGMA